MQGLGRRPLLLLPWLLPGSGALGAGASGPAAEAPGSAPGSAPGPIMAELSAYMAAATSRPLPEAVAEAARHHLLDTFAAMVSGAGLLPGRQAHRYARAQGGSGPATIAAAVLACLPAEAGAGERHAGACGRDR